MNRFKFEVEELHTGWVVRVYHDEDDYIPLGIHAVESLDKVMQTVRSFIEHYSLTE